MRLPVRARTAAAILAFVYFLFLLPWGTTLVIHYPDERYYVYNAYRMIETGDYILPRTPEGELRLKKPILPYWFSVAGVEIGGKGPQGFRLFYMLGACAVLLLTYTLARQFGAREEDSLLAMLLLAGNPMFVRFSVNAIPDVPLTLFMTIAALGFARLFLTPVDEKPPGWAVWTGWIGTALAILSKGLLPVAFIAFLLVFTLVFQRRRLAQVFAPAPVLVALALVASWYLYAFVNYPESFVKEFLDDQVQRKLPHNPLSVFPAIPGYLGVVASSFLFLPLVLVIGSWRNLWSAVKSSSPAVTFLLGWSVVVVLIFSAIGSVFGRYLMPVIPLVAVLLVLAFTADEGRRALLKNASRWLLAALLVLQLLFFLFGAAIEFQLAPVWEAVLVLVLSLGALAFGAIGVRRKEYAPWLLPAMMALTLPLIIMPVWRLVSPHPAEGLAVLLNASGMDPARAISVGEEQFAAAIRLVAGRSDSFRESTATPEALAKACVVMTVDLKLAEELKQKGFTVETVDGGWRKRHSDLVPAVLGWRLAEVRDAHAQRGYFATCPNP